MGILNSRAGRILGLCALLYLLARWGRPALPFDGLRASMPSFLLGVAMIASFDGAPNLRFVGSYRRALYLLGVVLLGAIWFEGVLPRLDVRATGDWRDAGAMLAGGFVGLTLSRPPSYRLPISPQLAEPTTPRYPATRR